MHDPSFDLIESFGFKKGDLVAIVGGGGKSSLMFAAEKLWDGPVVLTTTTRIFRVQIDQAQSALPLAQLDQLGERLQQHNGCLIYGAVEGEKALGVGAEVPQALLERPDVDLVLVEADGSRRLPVKAPAAHEPVIPAGTTYLVMMVGIDCLEKPLGEVAHRPELVSQITGLSLTQQLDPAALCTLLIDPHGGLKDAPLGARTAVCLNKVETESRQRLAEETAERLMASGTIDAVVIASLKKILDAQ